MSYPRRTEKKQTHTAQRKHSRNTNWAAAVTTNGIPGKQETNLSGDTHCQPLYGEYAILRVSDIIFSKISSSLPSLCFLFILTTNTYHQVPLSFLCLCMRPSQRDNTLFPTSHKKTARKNAYTKRQ